MVIKSPIKLPISRCLWTLAAFGLLLMGPTLAIGQDRDAQNKRIALGKKPRSNDIEYDSPQASEFDQCTIEPAKDYFDGTGFVVKNPAGQIVRMYIKQKDGAVHWTFFKNGNEVYREIDSDGDRRIDQYRWMGEAGSRWAVDTNQDGNIDSWKAISAEELAFEVFEALKSNDRNRFARTCLSNEDLRELQLGSKLQTQVADSVTQALKSIPETMTSTPIERDAIFVDFSGTRPSIVPAGKMGLGKDLLIYDNVSALFSEGGEIRNLSLGTIIKVGDKWRIAQLPELMNAKATVDNGRMFVFRTVEIEAQPLNEELQELIGQFNKVNEALQDEKDAAKKAELYQNRTDLILRIADASAGPDDKKLWVRMCATEASIGYQTDEYPKGIEVLEKLVASKIGDEEKAFVTWELIQAKARDTRKGNSSQMRDANRLYMDMLEEFVRDFPEGESTPQALLQLAMFEEFSNTAESEEKALKWYSNVATNFPDSREGQFAAGAKKRLTCYGEPLTISGTTLTNEQLDSASFRGRKNVVIHFWSTQDELSLEDFSRLLALQAKHRDLAIVGVNLDENPTFAKNFLRQKQPKARWPHLWAKGGKQNSPLALQLGVTTVPLTLLIDKQGKVAENQAITDELDRQIQRLRNRRK